MPNKLETPETPDKPNVPTMATPLAAYAKTGGGPCKPGAGQGRPLPLKVDVTVQSAAQVRAKEIVSSFSHTRPNGSSFSSALTEAGVSFRGAGENIAMASPPPKKVMEGWMNSSGHRANILNSSYTSIGVGSYQGAGGTPIGPSCSPTNFGYLPLVKEPPSGWKGLLPSIIKRQNSPKGIPQGCRNQCLWVEEVDKTVEKSTGIGRPFPGADGPTVHRVLRQESVYLCVMGGSAGPAMEH